MKNRYKAILPVLAVALAACDTDIENIGYVPEHKVDYTALKAYKASDHELIFGWFGGWDGGGISARASLRGLPDSVDMVSNWDRKWFPLTDRQMEDMKYVQQVKGTTVLVTIFSPVIGFYLTPEGTTIEEYWGWDASNVDKQEAATRKYAHAIAEKIIECGYDGLDIDNEPEKGSIYGNTRLFCAFVEELGKYFGPQSGSNRKFCLDGYLTTGLTKEMDKYFNYFISQAYYASSYSSYDSRLSEIVRFYTNSTREELAKKFIVTEDFERHAADGGPAFTDRDGNKMRSSEGLAGWKPLDAEGNPIMKGGSGLYHIELDYTNASRDYYYARRMIQIQNPVKQ